MQIASWNVNSIRARLPRLLAWLEQRKPDVALLQEVKCLDEQFPREEIEALGYNVATYGQKTYNGVAILAKEPLSDVVRGLEGDDAGGGNETRLIAAQVGSLVVASVYVVNGQAVGAPRYAFKLEWLARLRRTLEARWSKEDPFVMGGDFNVTFDDRDVHDPEAWREKILCSTPERAALRELMHFGLVDAFRKFHEEPGHYTWWDYRVGAFHRGQGLRIDHFLMTEPALARCRDVFIERDMRKGPKPSDHAPLIAVLDP
jgi:exodeoxyribonuclease-3